MASEVYNSGLIESPSKQFSSLHKATATVEQALQHIRLDPDTARRVCDILENCRKGENTESIEFQIVCDSQTLAQLAAESFAGSSGEWENLIQTSLRTEAAKNLARSLFHT
jgi:hypothetical protein